MNVISQVNSSCINQTQCIEVIPVPDQPVYDQYYLEINATSNIGTSFLTGLKQLVSSFLTNLRLDKLQM